jgi:hypothetical protein
MKPVEKLTSIRFKIMLSDCFFNLFPGETALASGKLPKSLESAQGRVHQHLDSNTMVVRSTANKVRIIKKYFFLFLDFGLALKSFSFCILKLTPSHLQDCSTCNSQVRVYHKFMNGSLKWWRIQKPFYTFLCSIVDFD